MVRSEGAKFQREGSSALSFFPAQVALKARYCAHGTTRERIKGGSFSSIDVLAIARITNMVVAFV
jgi:hypothetical protein